jgi:hypothetical protein
MSTVTLSVKIMPTKIDFTFVCVISMFILFREPRFNRMLFNIRALKGTGSSEINSVSSELEPTAVSRSVRLYCHLTSRQAGWQGGWVAD